MITVKVQCDCGQRYAFDVEPVNGRMPTSVVCPDCGADGTTTANSLIAQTLGVLPAPVAPTSAPVFVRLDAPPPPPSVGGLRLNTGAPANPPASAGPPPIPPPAAAPRARAQVAPPKPKRGKDGWATEETGFNKLGTWITTLPPILASMLPWGIMGVELSVVPVCIVMVICGAIGGTINIWGRGPAAAGAFIGLCIALGGYLATVWWIHGKESVYKFEIFIAFLVGAAPGFLLQVVLQKIMQKRAQSAD